MVSDSPHPVTNASAQRVARGRPGLTPGALLYRLRRDIQRGLAATCADYFIRGQVWRWRNPHATDPAQEVPVHLLCGAEQADMAAWMIASWTRHTSRNWRYVVHDDGSLTDEIKVRFSALKIDLEIIDSPEADRQMAVHLATRPACAKYREHHPLARKIFDAPTLTKSPSRFILLDTDVLFFAPPNEMVAWVERRTDESCWFNADCAEASNVSTTEAHQRLGVALWPRVNSGICLLAKRAVDLDFCERVLRETSILSGHIWRVEQTLFALCASRARQGGLLPPAYEVSLGKHRAPQTIARHYVGAVRQRFWGEGVWQTRRSLLHRNHGV